MGARMRGADAILAMAVLLLPSCGSDGKDSGLVVDEAPLMDELILPEPALRRLNQAQYHRAIVDLLGDDLVHPTSLEPDESIDGLRAIGASSTTISPRGVEQYEDAAYSLAEQALETGQGRQSLVPCEPESTVDTSCAEMFFTALGRRAWRRPLSADEVERLVSISSDAAQALDDFHAGLVYGVAALLQSPHFLFRVELGQETDDRDGNRSGNGGSGVDLVRDYKPITTIHLRHRSARRDKV